MKKFNLIILVFFTLNLAAIEAAIRLPNIISNQMVIQQNSNVNIWGWANVGEVINVRGSWQEEAVSTITDKQGKWIVTLISPKAGGSYEIVIEGENKIVIKDVLAGEVWLASGQSNMAFALKNSENSENDIANANYSEIRLFHVERNSADKPQDDFIGKWIKCSPESVKKFSASAYYFGRDIYKKLNVPVGLISASKGGSPIEAWIDEETLAANKNIHTVFEMWEEKETAYPRMKKEYLLELSEWEKAEAKDGSSKNITKPKLPPLVDDIDRRHHRRPGFLYNAMIAPIISYTIKGVLWYQGENNVSRWDKLENQTNRPKEYRKLFPLLISDWRTKWNLGNFPFYYVQIAAYDYGSENIKASLLREAQTIAMKVTNTGMVVTADIGDINDIHPKNKLDVGKRLALWALAKTYGFENVVCSGPLYKSMNIEGNKVRIYFDYTGTGLTIKGNELINFSIAGKNKEFYKANASIEDSTVVVYSENVQEPEAVRFSFSIKSVPNLHNKEGLPAAPFRTDTWKINNLE
ncbi:MAG: sialate O-acetylesterase [Melioribacteraceae bacterium]|nr:sialate O-acetylesterase [Melioribacteraceae bacterium]